MYDGHVHGCLATTYFTFLQRSPLDPETPLGRSRLRYTAKHRSYVAVAELNRQAGAVDVFLLSAAAFFAAGWWPACGGDISAVC
jgi:hypothetical protein